MPFDEVMTTQALTETVYCHGLQNTSLYNIHRQNKVISWHALHEVNHIDYTRVRGAKIKFSHTKTSHQHSISSNSPRENNSFPSRTHKTKSILMVRVVAYCIANQNITESYSRQGRDDI